MAWLISQSADRGPLALPEDGEVTIGRSPDNALVLGSKKVSRKHAVLKAQQGVCVLHDLSSTFGTFVNGVRLDAPSVLAGGETVLFGDQGFAFSLANEAAAQADATPQPPNAPAVSSPPKAGAPLPVGSSGVAKDDGPPVALDEKFAPYVEFYTQEMMVMKRRIHEMVLGKLNLAQVAQNDIQDDEIRGKLGGALDAVLREIRHELARGTNMELFREVMYDELIGYGPISPMLRDKTVDEVMANGPERIFVERRGRLYETGAKFMDNRHMIQIVQRIVEPLGRHVDEASPMVDARLPDGSRVNAIIPPLALDGSSITIRKFAEKKLTTDDLIQFGSMTPEIALFLEEAVRARQNIVVSGGTGSGKTTLLNVLSLFIPLGERVVTIEDSAELKLNHRNLVRLESRPANIEGRGRITIRDLLVNALRMRPDRIIVGECRSAEALDMLQAMNTGHDGSLTTVHANNPRDCLGRLETLVMMGGYDLPSSAVREQVASALNLVIQQSRLADGSRKITHITEVTGREGDVILMQDIFVYKQEGFSADGKVRGYFDATGNIPYFVEELKQRGNLRLSMDVFVPRC